VMKMVDDSVVARDAEFSLVLVSPRRVGVDLCATRRPRVCDVCRLSCAMGN
jgi:hypothetical protein